MKADSKKGHEMMLLSTISQYIAEIIAVIAIITALLVPIVQQTEKSSRNLLYTFVVSLALCILLFIAKIGFDGKYSCVPDVIGCTYDEAILKLHDAGFRPRFILTDTNDLSSVSCRVSWQSLPVGSVTNKDCLCILILDDNYQSDTTSAVVPFAHLINHFAYTSNELDQDGFPISKIVYSTVPLSGREWTYLGTQVTLLEDEIMPKEFFAQALADAAIIHLEWAQGLRPMYTVAEFNDASLFGKFILEDETNKSYEFCHVTAEKYNWLILLPKTICAGTHQFVGSIVTSNGENFEFAIQVIIEE